jgi:hypothetical protein
MAMSLCLNRIPQLLPQDDPPRGWSMVTDQSLGWFWASGSHEMASALPLKKHPESQWFFPKKVYRVYIYIYYCYYYYYKYSIPLSYAHQKPFKSPLIQILWSPSLWTKKTCCRERHRSRVTPDLYADHCHLRSLRETVDHQLQWRPLVTSTFWVQHNSYGGKSRCDPVTSWSHQPCHFLYGGFFIGG